MNYIIGCDAHKRYSQLAVYDGDNMRGKQVRVEHERDAIREFLSEFPEGPPVALENIGNWYWIVLRIDDFSFGDDVDASINKGQNIQLHISGPYVSKDGVDWGMCPINDPYCMNAGFIEGGFPQSEDYDGPTLCPSNTIVRSSFAPDDWINGMLAWRFKVITYGDN